MARAKMRQVPTCTSRFDNLGSHSDIWHTHGETQKEMTDVIFAGWCSAANIRRLKSSKGRGFESQRGQMDFKTLNGHYMVNISMMGWKPSSI